MNFNIYVDKRTGERLAKIAKVKRTSRNALIREALSRLLAQEAKAQWPREVLDFEGVPATRPFEQARKNLRSPRKDPLA